MFDGAGEWDIPIIEPEAWEPVEFIDFNRAMSAKRREDRGVHFFIDDYRFERIWTDWKRYGAALAQFAACMTPDFSMFTDWPTAVQLWNHYRKHFIGAYLQSLGVKVYPTICWSDRCSYEWCFDGEPIGGCVAVSSVGTQKNKESKRLFIDGYEAMLDRLKPETIIFYGDVPSECGGRVVQVSPFQGRFNEVRTDGRQRREQRC